MGEREEEDIEENRMESDKGWEGAIEEGWTSRRGGGVGVVQ